MVKAPPTLKPNLKVETLPPFLSISEIDILNSSSEIVTLLGVALTSCLYFLMFNNVGSETKLCCGFMSNQDPFCKWIETLLDRFPSYRLIILGN
ncbi:hypothetical protein OUZ56_015067 [Daphnia magna]|uniref:Uncharacterized protein n=1 Tax=Daphnia magna TaxID=35525 RepID=A0ABR0ALP7_9CRUS|nr:hypothetical protein OUZ56_015067 [Daphnia magna]